MGTAVAAAPGKARVRRRVEAIVLALLAIASAAPAAAQVGVSAAFHTDYRYRGYSLSQERPAAALNLAYDHGAGLYAGGSLIAAETARYGWRQVGRQVYGGYAKRFTRGPTFDLGVSSLGVKYYDFPFRAVENNEAYLGAVGDHASLRVAYAPNYFDQHHQNLYFDLGSAWRPAPDWRLLAHAGLLQTVGGRLAPGARRCRYDLSVGVARRFGHAEILLQATDSGPGRARGPDHDGLQLTATWNF